MLLFLFDVSKDFMYKIHVFAGRTAMRERRIQVADMRAPNQMDALGGLNGKEEIEYYVNGRVYLIDKSKEETRTYVNA